MEANVPRFLYVAETTTFLTRTQDLTIRFTEMNSALFLVHNAIIDTNLIEEWALRVIPWSKAL
jgi:hypothetical protein